jgi:hypothetical protein
MPLALSLRLNDLGKAITPSNLALAMETVHLMYLITVCHPVTVSGNN